VEAEQELLEIFAGGLVEGAEGFIEEDDFGFHDEGLGEGHALSHAAGEFVGIELEGVAEFDALEHVSGFGEVLAAEASPGGPAEEAMGEGGLVEHEADGDILLGGEERVEGVVLVDDAAIAAGAGDWGALGAGAVADEDIALVGEVGTDDGAEEGRLAAAAGADEGEELAARDLEIDVMEDADLAEGMADGAAVEGEAHGGLFAAAVPGAEPELEPAEEGVHGEAEGGEEGEVGIDDGHIKEFGLEADAVAEADIADDHFGGDEVDHGGADDEAEDVEEFGEDLREDDGDDDFGMGGAERIAFILEFVGELFDGEVDGLGEGGEDAEGDHGDVHFLAGADDDEEDGEGGGGWDLGEQGEGWLEEGLDGAEATHGHAEEEAGGGADAYAEEVAGGGGFSVDDDPAFTGAWVDGKGLVDALTELGPGGDGGIVGVLLVLAVGQPGVSEDQEGQGQDAEQDGDGFPDGPADHGGCGWGAILF